MSWKCGSADVRVTAWPLGNTRRIHQLSPLILSFLPILSTLQFVRKQCHHGQFHAILRHEPNLHLKLVKESPNNPLSFAYFLFLQQHLFLLKISWVTAHKLKGLQVHNSFSRIMSLEYPIIFRVEVCFRPHGVIVTDILHPTVCSQKTYVLDAYLYRISLRTPMTWPCVRLS